eukprot:scaffold118259_cov66-Phaeocystis_antarctica.AAC.2
MQRMLHSAPSERLTTTCPPVHDPRRRRKAQHHAGRRAVAHHREEGVRRHAVGVKDQLRPLEPIGHLEVAGGGCRRSAGLRHASVVHGTADVVHAGLCVSSDAHRTVEGQPRRCPPAEASAVRRVRVREPPAGHGDGVVGAADGQHRLEEQVQPAGHGAAPEVRVLRCCSRCRGAAGEEWPRRDGQWRPAVHPAVRPACRACAAARGAKLEERPGPRRVALRVAYAERLVQQHRRTVGKKGRRGVGGYGSVPAAGARAEHGSVAPPPRAVGRGCRGDTDPLRVPRRLAHPPLVRGSTRRCGIRAVGEGLTTAGRRVVVRGANVEEHVLAPLSMPVHRGVVRALAVPKARPAPRQRHTAHPPRTQWAACHGVSHLGIRHPRIVAKLLGPSREEHVIQPVAAEDDRRSPRHPARQPEAAACDCL